MPETTTIIIGGLAGTGSTTVAKILSKRLGYRHIYGGGIFRQLASQHGQTIEDFTKTLVSHPELERSVDEELIRRARQGRVIIESRVIPWLLPDDIPSFKVWLTCDRAVRSQRLDRREATDNAHIRIEQRELADAERYRGLYGLDLDDLSTFDMVEDTTATEATVVADHVMERFHRP